ncbi:MAG: glycosyltransferase family 4 protein [Pseudomonadota bacterium]
MTFQGAVLQVIPELQTGGAERTTIDIAKAVVDAGGKAVVAARDGGRMVDELLGAGAYFAPMDVHTKNPWKMWANRGRLIKLIAEHDIDIVHARSRAPAWSALWAARAAGRKFVTTYHGFYKAKTAPKRFYNSVMARGDIVIANSNFTRDHILATHNVTPDKVVAIPRGVDMDVFKWAKVEGARRAGLAAAWALDRGESRLTVLLPGRLTAWKGQSIAIEAAELLKNTGQQALFTFILAGDAQGRDGYEAELQNLIAARDVGDMVRIVGHCNDMPAAYAVCDIVLSTSVRPEAFGRVAAEAQAMGRPVIATDHGGARETVLGDVTGWLIPPCDAAALASRLTAFAKMSDAGRNNMGLEARRHVAERFSVEAMCEATLRAYERVLDA